VSKTELVPFDTTHVPAVDVAAGKIVVVPTPLSEKG
jgi:ribosomal 30S subunit maturation factor RimM